MRQRVLFSGGELLRMTSREESQPQLGWVGVEGNRIAIVTESESEAFAWAEGDDEQDSVECEIVDCRGKIVMPGLINTHTHLSMTLLRNYADDMDLHEWLNDYIWPFEAHLTADDIYRGARLGAVEMLLGGTTTFVDMYFKEQVVARAVEELGIRALLTETALDGATPQFESNLNELLEVSKSCSRVMVGVAPHAPYTCSPETLKQVTTLAKKYDLTIHTHLSETAVERAMIEERYGVSPLEYFEQNGVITPRSIVAHSVYLTDEEIARVAKSGASVAHNAQSNMKLASGVAPITKMLDMGVNCTIATDGVSSNNDLDMWDEMRTAALLQRVTTLSPTVMRPYDLLWMATRGGATAICRNDLGELAEGKLADIIVVDLSAPHMRPRHNLLSALLYSVKSSDVCDVMVDGVMRVVDREVVGADVEAIIADAEQSTLRIMDELNRPVK